VILLDTSIWMDHLRSGHAALVPLLDSNAVVGHPWITGEIALGNLSNRDEVLELLRGLPQATLADDDEVLHLIAHESLYGKGIGYVDARLLAAVRLTPSTKLWTGDKRLADVAALLGGRPSAPNCSYQERHHEVTSHIRGHQEHEHPRGAG
jgi:predicted nucleic acid-binding protein